MEHFYLNLLLLSVSFITLYLSFIFYKHRSQYKDPKLPPGKPGLPFIGESLEFLSAGWKGHPEKFIFERVTKYSSEVFKTSILGAQAVVFAGAAGNKFLFSNENKLVVAWWPDSIYKIFPSTLQDPPKEESIKFRKLVLQFMKPEALQRYVGIMDTMAQRHFANRWEEKKVVVVYPLAKSYTFYLACKLFLSLEDPNWIAKFSKPFLLLISGMISIPIDLPGTPFNKAIKASNVVRKELLAIIKQRKIDLAEGKATKTQDILSHMLTACDENGQHLNELSISDKIISLLIGGHDTASAACTFIVKYLSELPHIYEGVYQEQIDIARSKAPGKLLNWDDIQRMKYSWNVACEAMRLAPPLPGGFREALNDFVFNGFSIPKGWKLYWNANSTHKNAEYFPEPEKFDPSRFDGNGPTPYTFVPFGGGPRMCPGKEYARLEILVFMHNLVKRFKVEKIIPDEKIVVNPLPVPAKGLPIRLYPQKA